MYRSVAEQLDIVLAAARRLPADRVALESAAGRTLAAAASARSAVPPFDNSAMDGFAVRYGDVAAAGPQHPVRLQVVDDIPAGSDRDPQLGAGTAARIMTGAPVPADADTVVPFEDTVGGLADSLTTAVVARAPRRNGANIRRAGEDIAAGTTVLAAGTRLGPLQLSALAAAGVPEVAVTVRPRVVVASTGSELVSVGTPLRHGQIPESNGILLAGLVAEADAEVVLRQVVDDEGDGPAQVVAEAVRLGAHAVVFSGGISAGAYEVVRESLGAVMDFVKVGMQPGKPQGFGTTPEGMLLFGLPGNPVSTAVSFEVFVRPALLQMAGRNRIHRVRRWIPAAMDWTSSRGRRQYLPAVVDRTDPAHPTVRPATAGGSGSHLAAGLGVAGAYAIVAAEVDRVRAGDLVEVMEL